MRHLLPLVLILLSLALTGTLAKTTFSGDDSSPAICSPSETKLAEASLIPDETPFGLTAKSGVVNADDVLASINVEELRPSENSVYLLQAISGEGQVVLGFFTPLENASIGDFQGGAYFQDMLNESGQQGFRLIEMDSTRLALGQNSAPEASAPCID